MITVMIMSGDETIVRIASDDGDAMILIMG